MAAGGLYCDEEVAIITPPTNSFNDLRCSEYLSFSSNEENRTPTIPIPGSVDDPSGLPVKATVDRAIVGDDRVLQNLLRLEDTYLPSVPDYFKYVQKDITPSMRKIVADWMLQLCQELQCQPEVFSLAMNYMDRFLAKVQVDKSKLQLLGSVCLLISSKFRETRPIIGERLIFYTDFSITSEEIKDWELLLLSTLTWELSAVTPLDFLDQIIPRLGISRSVDLDALKQRAETILVLSILEYKFSYLPASLMASSALLSALHGVSNNPGALCQDVTSFREIKLRLQTLCHVIAADVDLCMDQMESILPDYLKPTSSSAELALADSTSSSVASYSTSPSDSMTSSSNPSVTSSAAASPKNNEIGSSSDFNFTGAQSNNDLSILVS